MSREPHFDGSDYVPERDFSRLKTQHERAKAAALIRSQTGWFTMSQIAADTGDPPASVERQIRYMRSKRFGEFVVAKRHVHGGTFEYRVLKPPRVVIEEDGQVRML